jgi:hypothetical protein
MPSTSSIPAIKRRSMTPTPTRRNVSANAGRVSPTSTLTRSQTSPIAFTSFEAALERDDPHAHPFNLQCTEPASALAIFRIAERYSLTPLSRLALDHMVANLTSETAFPLFLATHLYADLSAAVKAFIYSNWEAIIASGELERSLSEVAAGLWPASGTLLHDFLKSLSPSPPRV